MKKKLPKAISRPADDKPEAIIQPAPELAAPGSDHRAQTVAIQLVPPAADQTHAVGSAEQSTTAPPLAADRHYALKLVERFAFWAGAAGAIPIPGLDLAGVGAVQVQMIRRLADVFDVEFSQSRGKALIAAMGGALISGSSGLGAASLTKTIPVLGPAVSSIAVPTLAAGATYAIGVAFIEHFASGGTLLNFDLKRMQRVTRESN